MQHLCSVSNQVPCSRVQWQHHSWELTLTIILPCCPIILAEMYRIVACAFIYDAPYFVMLCVCRLWWAPEFQVGMKLEAVDRKNPYLVCVASVADVIHDRFLVHFDNWDDTYDYWWEKQKTAQQPIVKRNGFLCLWKVHCDLIFPTWSSWPVDVQLTETWQQLKSVILVWWTSVFAEQC